MNPTIKKIINRIDADRAHENTHWNISPEAGVFLYDLIIARNATSIVEVGTSIGYSALYLAGAASQTKGHVYTIESHANRFAAATSNFQKAKVTNIITQIKGHAPEVFDELPDSIDFAFLDATKMEHISYVEALLPILKYPACIVTDNILSHQKEMTEFMNFMKQLPNSHHELKNIGTGLLVSTFTNTL